MKNYKLFLVIVVALLVSVLFIINQSFAASQAECASMVNEKDDKDPDGLIWPGWDKFCAACPGEQCCNKNTTCKCPCESKRCDLDKKKCVTYEVSCECNISNHGGLASFWHKHCDNWWVGNPQGVPEYIMENCKQGVCNFSNPLESLGYYWWKLNGCGHGHSGSGVSFQESCLNFMRDTNHIVSSHGYKSCFTDQDCGAPAPTPTTKPYHYECDANSESLRDYDPKTQINTFYYQCKKVNTQGVDTCKYDLYGADIVKNKDLVTRLFKYNGNGIDLTNYSSQCISTNMKYNCDTYTYQCKSSFQGTYSSLKDCQDKCKTSMVYVCNSDTYQCREALLGKYKTMAECESHCTTSTKSTTIIPPSSSSTTATTGSPSSSSSSTIKPITSTTGKPISPEDESCSIIQFKITPNLASLLALSEGKVHFTAYWSTLYCNSCELWYLPVDSDEQPLRNKDGTQMEYTKVASNLPFESPDPTYEWDENNLYYIKNYPQKWGHYLYKLICKGSKNEYESFPVHIFVAPWMIWYEVPPVMPTSKFHTIITSPGWGQSIEEYKGY